MKTEQTHRFVVCLNNQGYAASLEVGKIYRVIDDREAETNGLIRIIDESGEDYAFSTDRFHPIELPKQIEAVLLSVLVRNVPGNAALPQNSQHPLQNTEPYHYAEPFEPALPSEDWEAIR